MGCGYLDVGPDIIHHLPRTLPTRGIRGHLQTTKILAQSRDIIGLVYGKQSSVPESACQAIG